MKFSSYLSPRAFSSFLQGWDVLGIWMFCLKPFKEKSRIRNVFLRSEKIKKKLGDKYFSAGSGFFSRVGSGFS